MTSASQCSIARYPELNPIRPVIPTSNGLSYSTASLPRNACSTGACSAPASAISCSWAPAQPAPARIVTRSLTFSTRAASASAASPGRTTGTAARTADTFAPDGASAKNTSPGMTSTATPLRCTAVRSAMSSSRGICAGTLTSSQ